MSSSTQNLSPIQQIEALCKQFEEDSIYKEVPECNENEESKKHHYTNLKVLNDEVNTILKENYGLHVTSGYGFFKYCAENSIYPLSFTIESEILDNHTDSEFTIDQLIEKYKDTIIASNTDRGNDTYDYITNKIKFFHDSGFHIIPGGFTVMKSDEICNKVKESLATENTSEIISV